MSESGRGSVSSDGCAKHGMYHAGIFGYFMRKKRLAHNHKVTSIEETVLVLLSFSPLRKSRDEEDNLNSCALIDVMLFCMLLVSQVVFR